ncbi:FAD-binding oxidoreductase [Aurantiacibacter xanthus]|uniref:FAD-binding oxidoreductase n=1 Tax=Aurantiacibacter xanthus TaxID=1784712 RepID=A0A3A1PA61_9SPHN|nr:FAD-binding oxidoreductase [Aurantiacibacter xanthus]RIV90666.1 FAD-binding oxidoreductase [Aurantiacibacter xanthus]
MNEARTTTGNLDAAIKAMEAAIGADNVLTTRDQMADHGDPYAPPGEWYEPGAVLMPGSVEEVQAIVRLANEHGTPLWTSSQGRNKGYGGGAPRITGSFTVSLRRMNRVLEVDEDNCMALVEPGVRFFDLYEHLRAIGSELWMSCPDLSGGSVIGNALEHGVGYTPIGDHFGNHCGMEVVLPDGDILRTGMGGMSNPHNWLVYPHSAGPSWDGIFTQSNYGIVTKMGVALMHPPEVYAPGWFMLDNEENYGAFLEVLRPLMIDGTISNQPMIINAVCAASAFGERRQWYTGTDSLPEEVIDAIAAEPGFGRWVMRFAVQGDAPVVAHNRAKIERAFATIPGASVVFEEYDGRNLPRMENPHHNVQAGVPSMALDQMTKWYGGEEGGHIGFSCAMPISGKDGTAIRDLARKVLNERNLDYSAAIIVGKRSMIHVALIVFDTKNEAQTREAYAATKAMLEPAARLGYGEYRSHLDFMDEVAALYDFNDNAQRRFAEKIKDCLDPNGILSPGKQGIWPANMR